jgi:hypothetical protein
MGRTQLYQWRADDPEFAAQWDQAYEAGTDRLADEATRRALESSDGLLCFLLKCRRPSVFCPPRPVAVAGVPGRPIEVADTTAPAQVVITLPWNAREAIPAGATVMVQPETEAVTIEAEAEPVPDDEAGAA